MLRAQRSSYWYIGLYLNARMPRLVNAHACLRSPTVPYWLERYPWFVEVLASGQRATSVAVKPLWLATTPLGGGKGQCEIPAG